VHKVKFIFCRLIFGLSENHCNNIQIVKFVMSPWLYSPGERLLMLIVIESS